MHAYWFVENHPDVLDGADPLAEPHLVDIARKLVELDVFGSESHEAALGRALPLLTE